MNKLILIFLIIIFSLRDGKAQIPAIGNESDLEIATWNLKWFGDAQNAPNNDQLQFDNIKNILQATQIDIWALQEVSNENSWILLLNELPGYQAALANYSQTQKTGLIFKSSMFTKVSEQLILNNFASDFAGRPPLEVALVPKNSSRYDTLFVIVVHLKANTGTTNERRTAHFQRKACAEHLKSYLISHPARNIVIAGDWNDDVDNSILYPDSISPFIPLFPNYGFFPTATLSAAGLSSYAFGGQMIDHIFINNKMNPHNKVFTSALFNPTPYITAYTTTTSDHYPVYNRFFWKTSGDLSSTTLNSKPSIYPNPATNTFRVDYHPAKELDYTIYDISGRIMQNGKILSGRNLEHNLSNGVYILLIEDKELKYKIKFVVNGR